MLSIRLVLSIAMILLGAWIVVRMLQYPLAQSFVGIVLGGAMIALGVIRLRQIRAVRRPR